MLNSIYFITENVLQYPTFEIENDYTYHNRLLSNSQNAKCLSAFKFMKVIHVYVSFIFHKFAKLAYLISNQKCKC